MSEVFVLPTTYHILCFDPPSTTNLGWACFKVKNGVATLAGSGVEVIPNDDDDVRVRLLHIEAFVTSLFAKYPNITVMCFERSIGGGWAPTRENLGEATGVIKLIGGHRDVEIVAIHTGQMAKDMTGSAKKAGKKSRIKRLAKDTFFPDSKTFIEIAHYINDEGDRVEFFEHQADAILFGMHHLLTHGIRVEGAGGSFDPIIKCE
jgi:Holliday junction resolvasome RuvABC endonuclease subunit